MLVELAATEHEEAISFAPSFTRDVIDLIRLANRMCASPRPCALGSINPNLSVAVPVLAVLFKSSDANLRRGAADGLTNLLQAAVQPAHQPEGGLRNQAGRARRRRRQYILPAFQAGYGDNQVVVRQLRERALWTALLLYQLTTDPAKREGVDDTEIQYVQRQLEAECADLRPLLLGLRDQTPYLTVRGTGYGCSGSARGSLRWSRQRTYAVAGFVKDSG